jgi:hypothetical protein
MFLSDSKPPSNKASFDHFRRIGVYDASVVLRSDLPRHVTAAEAGDSAAIALVQGVSRCLRTVEAAAAPRCLGCDEIFHDTDEIGAFAIVSAFVDPARMLVAGFCTDCTARRDLLALVLHRARDIWENVQPVDAGRA